MSFLQKQAGVNEGHRIQAKKDHQSRGEMWGGPYCLKQAIEAAIDQGKTSIFAAMINYQEPNLSEIEEELLIERGYGSEEFEMNFRTVPNSLAMFEITLRYPRKKKNPITPSNPRGAGRRKMGADRKVSISGLSAELIEYYDSIGNKSEYFRSLLQADFDRQERS